MSSTKCASAWACSCTSCSGTVGTSLATEKPPACQRPSRSPRNWSYPKISGMDGPVGVSAPGMHQGTGQRARPTLARPPRPPQASSVPDLPAQAFRLQAELLQEPGQVANDEGGVFVEMLRRTDRVLLVLGLQEHLGLLDDRRGL